MSALSLITTAVNNFQPTKSVLAGGAASILVCAIGAVLVAAGIAIPPIGFLGLTAATPLTMTMVTSAAIPIGHLVTAIVPDSANQYLNGLAKKLQVDVENLRSYIPHEYYSDDDFPKGRNGV